MQESYAARQPESDRTRDGSAQKPPRAQEPLQRAIDPSRLAFYDQLLGHRPPAGIRLSPSPPQPSAQPVQRQVEEAVQQELVLAEEEDVQRHESVSLKEVSPLQQREALRTALWGSGVPPWLRLSPPPVPLQREQQPVEPLQRKENTTGLPDRLKEGVENLSGLPLDDVQVHYHSSKPAQVQALAYTQGTEIHIGLGQEEHLAHEAWHVVQQKQGRVRPTMQAKGVSINDDDGLEREADVMGTRAFQIGRADPLPVSLMLQATSLLAQRRPVEGNAQASNPIQMLKKVELPEEEYGLGFSEEALKLRQNNPNEITPGQNVATFHFIPRPPLQGQAAVVPPDFHKTATSTGTGVYDIHTFNHAGREIKIFTGTNLSHSEHELITGDLQILKDKNEFPNKFVIDWVYTERPACPDFWSAWGKVICKGCSTELEMVEDQQKRSTPDNNLFETRSDLDIFVYSTFSSNATQEIALAFLFAPIRVQVYHQLKQDLYQVVTQGLDFGDQAYQVRDAVETQASDALPSWKGRNLSGSPDNQKMQYSTILKFMANQILKQEQDIQDSKDIE